MTFFADRLKAALREKGVRHDLVDAVFALGGEDDLVRLLARVEALRGFIESDDGKNLLVAYRRAANIVKIEAKKDKSRLVRRRRRMRRSTSSPRKKPWPRHSTNSRRKATR